MVNLKSDGSPGSMGINLHSYEINPELTYTQAPHLLNLKTFP